MPGEEESAKLLLKGLIVEGRIVIVYSSAVRCEKLECIPLWTYLDTEWDSMYSLMSILTTASSESNRKFASVLHSSVLPTQ